MSDQGEKRPVSATWSGAEDEVKRKYRCSQCNQFGHNKATCKQRLGGDSTSGSRNIGSFAKGGKNRAKSGQGRSVGRPKGSPSTRTPSSPRFEDPAEDQSSDAEMDVDDHPDPTMEVVEEDDASSRERGSGTSEWEDEDVFNHPCSCTRSGCWYSDPMHPRATSSQPGARDIPAWTRNPGDFMNLLFSDDILQRFVEKTNSYVANQKKKAWGAANNLTVVELKKFFGLSLYMGILQLPERKKYWERGIFRCSFVDSVMSRDRYQAIASSLHWEDTSGLSAAERTEKNRQDGFWTVEGFLQLLVANFQRYYQCGQFLSVDEMCIFFKGRHRCKCYNPRKPNKWHFKAFCLNCAQTGYLSNFFMYRGRDEKRPVDVPATQYPVERLTECEDYHGKGHIVCTDNWYTSVGLVEKLAGEPRRMDFVGTVRTGRGGLCEETIFKQCARRQRGSIKCSSRALHGDKRLYQTAWQDGQPVHILSTFPTKKSSVRRNTKTANGEFQPIEIDQPTVVAAYNKGMGGTDKLDQFTSYYDDRHRSACWQMRIYLHFLRVAAVNANILYNHGKPPKDRLTLLEFIRQMVVEWCVVSAGVGVVNGPPAGTKGKSCRRKKDWEKRRELRLMGSHHPTTIPARTNKDPRGKCKMCDAKCRFKCKQCGVFLCIKEKDEHNCWIQFHTLDTF